MRSQIGAIAEAAYGTYLAPDRFFEFLSETLARDKRTIQSDAIRARGTPGLRHGRRRVVTGRSGSGRVNFDVGPDLFGLWFEHMLGSVASAQPDDVGAPSVWEHTFTFGSLWDKSLTVQKGVERKDETVVPYSFVGSKVTGWELSVGVDEFLKLNVDIDSQDVLTDQPLEAATFPDGNFFHFMQASLSLGGTPVAGVTRPSITGSNPMATEDYYIGNQGLKGQPREEGYRGVSGQIDADFIDEAAMVEAFAADTPLSLSLSFVGEEIEGGLNEELTVTLAEVRLDGETPKVSGMELPTLTVPFTGFDKDAAEGITIVLQNADAAA